MITIKSCKHGVEIWADGTIEDVITDMLLAIQKFYRFLGKNDEHFAEIFKGYMIEHVDTLFLDDEEIKESETDEETFTKEDMEKLLVQADSLIKRIRERL